MHNCEARCEKKCEGVPDVMEPAECPETCTTACGGSCTAQANVQCQVDCQTNVYEECQTELVTTCETKCEDDGGAIFCDGQFVNAANAKDCASELKATFNFDIDVHAACRGRGRRRGRRSGRHQGRRQDDQVEDQESVQHRREPGSAVVRVDPRSSCSAWGWSREFVEPRETAHASLRAELPGRSPCMLSTDARTLRTAGATPRAQRLERPADAWSDLRRALLGSLRSLGSLRALRDQARILLR